MKKATMRLFSLALLMIISMGAEAQVKVEIGEFTGGKITEKSQTKPDEKGLVTVTITVTPDKGYTISQNDITVVATYPISGSRADTRAPEIAAPLTLLGKDPEDLSAERDYTFIISSTLGVWVQEANFKKEDDGSKGNRDIVYTEISDLEGLNAMAADGIYKITADINASGYTTKASFTGILTAAAKDDGTFYTLSNLGCPLFTTATGAEISNIILDQVNISQAGKTGSIACTANGTTSIYNCGILSGSVGSTGTSSDNNSTDCCGGLVGFLDGTARVINCYSYATITGGNRVGGIVGYNNYQTTSAADKLKTMVMNCMFYGDITGGVKKAPIYHGKKINNIDATGVGNYNYFSDEASYVKNNQIDMYYCALMAEKRFLQRFEFYRYLLNSHRELAAWWATGDRANKDLMAKWVLEPSQIGSDHPYPILKAPNKQYPSVVNFDAKNAVTKSERNKGGKLGTLTVNIQMGSGGPQFSCPTGATITTSQLTLNITDKDYDHFNFNYYKVQLPYYNDVGTGNYTGNRVVTGWKIVSITGGTPGTFTTGSYDAVTDANGNITKAPYNFADRFCTNKDLYGTGGSNRVFNQGAYWDVPEGVTAITIEPYWAKAAYIADAYADVVYNTNMTTPYNVPNVGGGQIYINGVSTFNGDDQIVYTNTLKDDGTIDKTAIANALAVLSPNSSHTVNDYAVVLVGNYHQYHDQSNLKTIESGNKPYTVTSVDLDHDNEPDYSFMLRFNGRTPFHPVKYDFLNLIGLGMAQKSTSSKGSYNFGIPQPKYWFEVTNTALFRVTQMEYSPDGRSKKPIIMQGGVIEQWVTQQKDAGDRVEYFHVGSNVWFKEFHRGSHQDNAEKSTTHPPLSVTGGDFEKFYLTGAYQPLATNYNDDAECYINGGRFGIVAGAGMEGIGDATNQTKGNIIWQIDNADINEFYGGGINGEKPIQGNITTVIRNSHVGLFCGGPKFGDMNSGRTVKTTATNCFFETYFGAGYGGNSYFRAVPANFSDVNKDPWKSNDDKGYNLNWNQWVAGTIKANLNGGKYSDGTAYNGYKQNYISSFGGVSVGIDYQFLPMSNNSTNVARLFIDFVSFSLATTHNVTSNLTGCTITGNFYGGGSLGKVEGPVTSTLTDCTVDGSVFGAGYSASLPTVSVMPTSGFKVEPNYDKNTGVFVPGELPDYEPDVYHWEHRDEVNSTDTAIDSDNHILYTTENLTTLGTVTGEVTLNIEGNTRVYGRVWNDDGSEVAANIDRGGVFGGGDASDVTGNTTVQMTGGTVEGSVYGGANLAKVTGNTTVIVSGGTVGKSEAPVYAGIVGNVYGGGKGLADDKMAGLVTGTTTVTISDTEESPLIYHNVYGGGAYGSVGIFNYDTNNNITGYTSGGTCTVEITGGTIGTTGQENGMVFGSSRGDVARPAADGVDPNDRMAWVHDTHVIIGTDGSTDNTKPLIKGSVYGSGENGHTYTDTQVDIHSGTIGITSGEAITIDGTEYEGPRFSNRGNVYGGGCGTDLYTVDEDGDGNPDKNDNNEIKQYYNFNAGIVLGTTTVNMNGGHVVRNIYGAGAMGSAGTFTLDTDDTNNIPDGKPISCATNTGICNVNISGGMVGMPGASMSADNGPDDFGHVFGAGRGEVHDSTVYVNMRLVGYVNTTDVKISENAFITGSVYGGSESGHVLGDTHVTVSGGQIGVGEGEDGPYTDWSVASMKECSHWPYEKNNSPYDMYSGDEGYTSDAAKGGLKKATDGHTFYGNVFGGGSGYYPYAPGKWVRSAGLVEGDTHVTISGGHILSNVYGGNEHTDVYGSCTVEMTGGTVGVPRTWEEKQKHPVVGSLFGAGKGDKRVLFNTWTNVKSTSVTVSGGTVYGSVFGGGEDGHVLGDATTTIEEIDSENHPTIIGTLGTTGYDGNVFGGGRGSYTALTAGVVCGNVKLDVKGGKMLGSVYGGGRLASVGTHLVPPTSGGDSQTEHSYYGKQIADGKKQVDWEYYLDNDPVNDADVEASGVTHGHITVNISGGTIGAVDNSGKVLNSSYSIGDVFGGCKGTTNGEYSNRTTGDNSEVAYNPVSDAQAKLGIAKSTIVNLLGGTVGNSIYGGGEVGNVGELGVVSVENSTITYEDPTLAFAKINLLGGTVQNVYGGGLGMKENVNGAKEDAVALVKGDVKVNLNGLEPGDYDGTIHGEVGTGEGKLVAAYNEDGNDGYDFYRANAGCIVTGTIFGCNNLNGTPTGHAKVHVFKTRAKAEQAEGDYDVAAVYGGGNRADYIPAASDAQQKTEVIIEGCDLTSIQQVYGGGNAAATPGTLVLVKGTKIIDEVFGGGNGVSSPGFDNPGANVGFYTGTTTPYGGDNGGKSLVQLMAGKVHNAYGGSNTKGDIRGGSNVVTVDNEYRENATGCCRILEVDYMFGGGKNAGMKSGANIILGCSNSNVWVKEIYAGAENADVEGDVSLTITSGKFGRVFGGNKESGKLEGSITVNIEENGQCGIPVIIGEIYGGGNKAPYSIYGFDSNGNILTNGTRKHDDPQVNIRAFTSIGNVYGGGYGLAAVMYGNPTVNINEVVINHTDHDATYDGNEYGGETIYFVNDVLDPNITADPTDMSNVQKVVVPAHTDGKMGAIQNVFGGGNAAAVHGNTNVYIGTTPSEPLVQLNDKGEPMYNTDGTPKKTSMDVVGADIRGNVYGGGNQAEVTGNTNVMIGKDGTTTVTP